MEARREGKAGKWKGRMRDEREEKWTGQKAKTRQLGWFEGWRRKEKINQRDGCKEK